MSSFTKQAIATYPVLIFSKSYCPFSARVKQLFTELGVRFQSFELDQMENGSAIQSELGKITGATTVPRVFINHEFVGGCDDTLALHRSGNLMKKLQSVK